MRMIIIQFTGLILQRRLSGLITLSRHNCTSSRWLPGWPLNIDKVVTADRPAMRTGLVTFLEIPNSSNILISRSSGHASMSDNRSSYFSSSPTDDVDTSAAARVATAGQNGHHSHIGEAPSELPGIKTSSHRRSAIRRRQQVTKRGEDSIFATIAEDSTGNGLESIRNAIEALRIQNRTSRNWPLNCDLI